MSMSSGSESGAVMSEINVTPLVDVMLVLLIIFMITAPLMSHRITVALPKASPPKTADLAGPQPLDLAVKEDGTTYLNDAEVDENSLQQAFKVAGNTSPQPELQIRAAKDTPYKIIRKVLSEAKDQGMVHVGFITNSADKER